MAQQTINVGTAPNDGTGTPLRTAFQYTNSNFTELYTATGPSGNNINVPGAATITGNLTAGGNVGFGTTNLTSIAGYNALKINNATTGAILDLAQGDAYRMRLIGSTAGAIIETAGTNPFFVKVGGLDSFRIDAAGVFNWYDGAGGTRMTLNSTGLGIGASPTQKFHVKGIVNFEQISGGTNVWQLYTYTDGTYRMNYNGAGSDELIIDTSGNVGIGVTPSAWSAGGFVQLSNSRAFAFAGAAGDYISNGYFDGSWKYTTTAAVSRYRQDSGSHQWLTAPSGTAGNAITFTERLRLKETGQLRFVPLAADPAGAEAGDVYYNSTSNKLKCYNGTTWNDLF